ncbi:RNA ligase family protein [Cohnella hashimotonis]|uniref:RNA ligase family protein n=1 Tax=Cohnella hashimotonis TaxID=2826895 RepID=A0ABT6TGR0_9BACL|nr:RNA ligase family protein [Cohnella hashimotonis]MDI4646024.1 RNA ligase family protein [Cohnella hashimotonis]
MEPFTPMSPVAEDRSPTGSAWVHQLKWDGYRLIAEVRGDRVRLYSKRMLLQNDSYPELTAALATRPGDYILDGEAVILDPRTGRPSFQLMQQRGKLLGERLIEASARRHPVQYILFDLLAADGQDLRRLPYSERRERLIRLTQGWQSPFYVADEFDDGEALWHWVEANGWEGVVSKKKASFYKEGKEHRDWLKRKTVHHMDVDIVGIIWKEGRVSSLVMRKDDLYMGRVSSGLNDKAKAALRQLSASRSRADYWDILPEGLRGADVRWLDIPLAGRVSGREMTDAGLLRHPKLIDLEGIPL